MFSRSGKALRLAACACSLAALAACGSPGTRPVAGSDGSQRAVQARSADERSADELSAEAGAVSGDSAAGEAVPGAATMPEIPEAAAALHARATAAMAAEAWLDAELELEQLVLEYPSYPGPWVNLAILYRRDGRVAEAEAALGQALAIAPQHPAANNELGMLQRERGEFAAAEASYRRAIAGDAAYALAHYNLGVLLDLYLGRADEALRHYETYQSLQPEPDREVGFWIVDLRRRLGLPETAAEPEQAVQLAQEDGR